MTQESLIKKSLTERWREHQHGVNGDPLRAKLIDAVSEHEGWEESAIALVDEALMPVIRQHAAEQPLRLTKEDWTDVVLADFQTENNRTKEQEWEAAYAPLFKQLNDLAAMKREPGYLWQPMETVPKKEDEVFLVRLPGNDVCKTLAIQVSVFEGRMYPDCKDGLIDWDDAIVGADAWSPLPENHTEAREK